MADSTVYQQQPPVAKTYVFEQPPPMAQQVHATTYTTAQQPVVPTSYVMPQFAVSEQVVHMDLANARGFVVNQVAQPLEAIAQMLDIPYEQQNNYKVGLLPADKKVKSAPDDKEGWQPGLDELQAIQPYFTASEKSDCCDRTIFACLGLRNMRPMKIYFTVNNTSGDVYFVERPFKCGGCCGAPLEMKVYQSQGDQRLVGRVRENFQPYFHKCLASCCMATVYHDIERAMPNGEMELQYTMRANLGCCGRVNNCCGATCWKSDMVFDILDTNGEVVAHLQKTFAGGDNCDQFCRASFRAGYDYDNYILEFPEGSTPEDRMLLLTSILQLDFHRFEMPQQNNRHHHHS